MGRKVSGGKSKKKVSRKPTVKKAVKKKSPAKKKATAKKVTKKTVPSKLNKKRKPRTRKVVKKKKVTKPTRKVKSNASTKKGIRMPKKTVFVAFSMKDVRSRDFLKGQSLNTKSSFEYIDMSVKQPYLSSEWKARVRTRIKRSNGVIAIVSKNSLTSTGQKFEIQCAKDERKPLIGIWAYKDDRTNLVGVNTYVWTWTNIANFIDRI